MNNYAWLKDRNFMQKYVGVIMLALLVFLLIMLSAQETFKEILVPLGLYHLEGGVFTDCSLPENKNIKYCLPPQSPSAKEWKNIKEGAGFKLAPDDLPE